MIAFICTALIFTQENDLATKANFPKDTVCLDWSPRLLPESSPRGCMSTLETSLSSQLFASSQTSLWCGGVGKFPVRLSLQVAPCSDQYCSLRSYWWSWVKGNQWRLKTSSLSPALPCWLWFGRYIVTVMMSSFSRLIQVNSVFIQSKIFGATRHSFCLSQFISVLGCLAQRWFFCCGLILKVYITWNN